jgi:glucose-6-phosphate isomerase
MTTDRSGPTALPAWHALTAHFEQVRDLHLRSLFADDPSRRRFVAEGAGSRPFEEPYTDETIRLLVGLADDCNMRERIEAMFNGEEIDTTEERAVLRECDRERRRM